MVKTHQKEFLNSEEVKSKEEKLLSPKYDVVFHALFRKGNENITKALIQDITQREYKIIDMDKNVIITNDNIILPTEDVVYWDNLDFYLNNNNGKYNKYKNENNYS